MFTPRQLIGLGLIKKAIESEPEGVVRNLLLLAWSASIAKLNRTFLSAKGRAASRGGSSIFSIYRYKLASESVELPIWETFQGRFLNVLEAKEEVLRLRDYRLHLAAHDALAPRKSKDMQNLADHTDLQIDSRHMFRVLATDAAKLEEFIECGTVDYIFTDPPYGAFISYLDLSILWNHWLGFSVDDQKRQAEAIVGGELSLSEAHYKSKLEESINACVRLLKPDRWFSIVFQHWDASYFATILETATGAGAELKAAITQTGDVIWSMHKKKNSVSVLSGEMILTFYKSGKAGKRHFSGPTRKGGQKPGDANPVEVLKEVFDDCLRNGRTMFTSEALFNRLIIELWRRRSLNCLNLDREEFAVQLRQRGWTYNAQRHIWSRRNETVEPEDPLFAFYERE